MRCIVGLLLLLVQLGPLAGAGMCLHAAAQPKDECSMPMQGMAHENDQSHPSPGQDCAQMVICAPAAPVVPQVAVQLFGVTQPNSTNYSAPASLFPGDPIAPPQPPPIA